jgi:hypothetical protein
MNRSLVLLLACVTGCSRAEASGELGAPTPKIVRVSVKPPRRWPQEYPSHFFRVQGIALTTGDEPSADHPAGTVYVLENPRAGSLALAEWDLATGAALRRRALPFESGDDRSWVVHDGDRVHLMARGAGTADTYYALLDSSFRVLWRRPIKELGWTSATALATDGTLTLVAGNVPSYDGAGGLEGYAATFDRHGKLLAGRTLPYDEKESSLLADCAAVVQYTPYILRRQGGGLRLHQLTPDLKEVISTLVPTRADALQNFATLSVRRDRLVVDAPPEQQFEFSFDLTEMREVPRLPLRSPRSLEDSVEPTAECWKSTTVGPMYALLCNPYGDAKDWTPFIAWDRKER